MGRLSEERQDKTIHGLAKNSYHEALKQARRF